MKRRIIAFLIVTVIAGVCGYLLWGQNKTDATISKDTKNTQQATDDPEPTVVDTSFDKTAYSISDPASIWVVVNKKRPLAPTGYTPGDLTIPNMRLRSNITSDERQVRAVTADALQKLSAAAQTEGLTLTLESGYRSYDFQRNLYNRYVAQQGQAVADTQSARAGHSEHQTGLVADVGGITQPACNVEACYAETAEGIWVANNAHKYGFVVRYPEDKTSVTGYIYEPWHLRYVGIELAAEMREQGIETLEEFFELPAAPDYN